MSSNNSTTRAILFELVLDIVIFAVCAAICVQIFVLSQTTMTHSRDLSFFNVETQSIANVYKNSNGNLHDTAVSTSASIEGGVAYIYYDAEYQKTDKENSVFTISMTQNSSNGVNTITILTSSEGIEEIIKVNASEYTGLGGA